MEGDQIDKVLIATHTKHKEKYADKYVDHYLEQYRIYLNIFNSVCDRRQKSNEFFLGLNTAILGIIGYVETKDLAHSPIIFILIPLAGIAICLCWHQIISSFSQLNRAKFKIIHTLEKKLPATLFETEWHILGEGKDRIKYYPLSHVEKFIPIIFIIVYVIVFLANLSIF